MNSIWIAVTMIRRITSKRKNIFFFLLVPSIVVSFAIQALGSFDKAAPTVGFVDLEGGAAGKAVLSVLERQFDVVPAADEDALTTVFVDGLTNSGVIVREDGSLQYREWRAGADTAAVQITVDGISRRLAEPENAGTVQPAVTVKERPKGNGIVPNALGLLLMFILLLTSGSVATILEDRSGRTLSRMYTAPVRPIEISLGLFLGMLAIGLGQIGIVTLMNIVIFGVAFTHSLGLQLLILVCFLFAAVGMSTAIAGVARHRHQIGIINSLVITPSCMLGGCFWPAEFMPEVMQRLSNIVPQKWAMDGFIALAGGGTLSDIAWPLLILMLFAAVTIGLGSAVLKPEQETVSG
ncbi:ABC transporter permease [Paenibacillus thermotolerans]|uniref:ABC transporter permease n=1 Tax=Paenibacillus thermotolerans TaxID=3027807 RepID=UPI0023682448|nr:MULTISPECIES: ABC transporter permease [unclassified Paenibacillus]